MPRRPSGAPPLAVMPLQRQLLVELPDPLALGRAVGVDVALDDQGALRRSEPGAARDARSAWARRAGDRAVAAGTLAAAPRVGGAARDAALAGLALRGFRARVVAPHARGLARERPRAQAGTDAHRGPRARCSEVQDRSGVGDAPGGAERPEPESGLL